MFVRRLQPTIKMTLAIAARILSAKTFSADALTMRCCFGLQTGIRRSASPVSPTLAPSWRARACLKIIVRPQPILDYGALRETVLE